MGGGFPAAATLPMNGYITAAASTTVEVTCQDEGPSLIVGDSTISAIQVSSLNTSGP